MPEVGAAFLLVVLGYWILAGAWPSAGWQGEGWVDSPAVMPERVWFSRLVFFLAAYTAQNLAVSPAGMSAFRLWDATRWMAWVAFVVATVACLSTKDRRKRWGLLDASGLFFMWALSDVPMAIMAALAVSQSMALSLGAMAPTSRKVTGVWVVKITTALLLPGWWVLSMPGGVGILQGTPWVWMALLWFTVVILRGAEPLSSEETTSAESERGFWMLWGGVLALFLLLFLLQ
jgi:hypothetical protein